MTIDYDILTLGDGLTIWIDLFCIYNRLGVERPLAPLVEILAGHQPPAATQGRVQRLGHWIELFASSVADRRDEQRSSFEGAGDAMVIVPRVEKRIGMAGLKTKFGHMSLRLGGQFDAKEWAGWIHYNPARHPCENHGPLRCRQNTAPEGAVKEFSDSKCRA